MDFTKMQGAGNDFVLVEPGDAGKDWAQMALVMCNRRFGVGADGLLLLMPSKKAGFRMRMFNPDGSEAEACGNGLRCLAKYILDNGLAGSGVQEIFIETAAGVRKVKYNGIKGIQVSMGEPKFAAPEIPVTLEGTGGDALDIKIPLSYSAVVDGWQLLLDLVSMGNPHAVYFQERPVSDFPLAQLGPKIENHKMFPRRTNFEVVRVLSRSQIEVRVWERGAGETLACGSGACAVAVAARLHGYIDSKVDIKLPGGMLGAEWDGTGEVFLSGPAEIVFRGEWPEVVK